MGTQESRMTLLIFYDPRMLGFMTKKPGKFLMFEVGNSFKLLGSDVLTCNQKILKIMTNMCIVYVTMILNSFHPQNSKMWEVSHLSFTDEKTETQ